MIKTTENTEYTEKDNDTDPALWSRCSLWFKFPKETIELDRVIPALTMEELQS